MLSPFSCTVPQVLGTNSHNPGHRLKARPRGERRVTEARLVQEVALSLRAIPRCGRTGREPTGEVSLYGTRLFLHVRFDRWVCAHHLFGFFFSEHTGGGHATGQEG